MRWKRPTDGVLGIFSREEDLRGAIRSVEETGDRVAAVFSPLPLGEMGEVFSLKPSALRYLVLGGGFLGLLAGLGLAVFASLQWKLDVSGKPVVAWVPFTVIGYECAILGGVAFTLMGVLLLGRILRFRVPRYYDARFTEDHFGVLVPCPSHRQEEVSTLLKTAGAEEVHEVRT
jgi:hypothetical protein